VRRSAWKERQLTVGLIDQRQPPSKVAAKLRMAATIWSSLRSPRVTGWKA
jgi:hypothetical protein